jgi:glycosyltransferase involved in cell wall biosynthesis
LILEPIYLRFYRDVPVFTESESTRNDLKALRFRGPVTVVPIGLEPIENPRADKALVPTFLYVGRLASSKRVTEIIQAFATFRAATGTGQLWVVGAGSGSYTRSLYSLTSRLALDGHVRFWGYLSTSDKHRRMAEAHVLLMASVREGWGLVVTEANALGTPAIVYDVPGLRDAVIHGQTGLVVRPSPESLANGMLELWRDHTRYQLLRSRAQDWSRTFSVEAATEVILERIIQTTGASRKPREVQATRAPQ